MNNLTETTGVLRLSGPLTIRHAAEHRDTLMAALSSNNEITLDLPSDAEADISFVQLLLAARVSAHANGKQIQLKDAASGPLRDVVERGGFLAADEKGFWSKGALSQ